MRSGIFLSRQGLICFCSICSLHALVGGDGNCRAQQRPLEIRLDLKEAAQFFEPLANSRQTDADVARLPEPIENFARNSHPEVFHRKDHFRLARTETNVDGPAAGMTMDVGERLLQDSKQSSFR